MDGESAGHLEDETFSADKATITIRGVSAHPGFAKGKIENAIKIASRIVERLPRDTCSPETTDGARASCTRPTCRQHSKVRRSASSCATSAWKACARKRR